MDDDRSTATKYRRYTFRLPPNPIYIELEQPRLLHKHMVAAFSFIPIDSQRWAFHVINSEGQTVWLILYEKDAWILPNTYSCPEQSCTTEEVEDITFYILCHFCQECITHYTSWLAIALRMIAGDFQEQIQVQEPETILELSEAKEKSHLHRFHIISYYDACKRKSTEIQRKRGSWMTGRPLAENEYEVNLEAVIYIKIYLKEHNRTYRHDRYTHMKGETQHIDSKPRMQPMTIATYKRLQQIPLITRVVASKFE